MQAGHHKRVRSGHPWAYANEIDMAAAREVGPPGSLVRLQTNDGAPLGIATFNPHPLIAVRVISRDSGDIIDEAFLARRLARALAMRDALYGVPYYRLIHAEADGLAGLIVDRFGDAIVVQVNTAGMERLLEPLLGAIAHVLAPRTVILRNDTAVRELEGLPSYVKTIGDAIDGPIEVLENGCIYFADSAGGQKTGWFYDQRDNRAFAAALARGRTVADFYCFTGGFAIAAAAGGATNVRAFDRSAPALALGEHAANANPRGAVCSFERGETFPTLERLAGEGETFGLVIVDPPAFVKSRKDFQAGVRGYRKLTRLAAEIVAPDGYLLVASCSHHVDLTTFADQIRRGLSDARRGGRILRSAGAAPDHPVHPNLPESAYLKAMLLQLD